MSAPTIDSYRFGHIVVDGQPHSKDLIILPTGVITNWWRKEGHTLLPDDLGEIMTARPDLLVIGQGAYSRMAVTREAQLLLQQAGIEVVAQATRSACATYNRLRAQQAVAAALHLTC